MTYKGYKIRIDCKDWEQLEVLDRFLQFFKRYISLDKLQGLGFEWSKDKTLFSYALGAIDDEEIWRKISKIDFSEFDVAGEFVEIELPIIDEWECFSGRLENIRNIYDLEIDSQNREYDYELEYIDSNDNISIEIHFVE